MQKNELLVPLLKIGKLLTARTQEGSAHARERETEGGLQVAKEVHERLLTPNRPGRLQPSAPVHDQPATSTLF